MAVRSARTGVSGTFHDRDGSFQAPCKSPGRGGPGLLRAIPRDGCREQWRSSGSIQDRWRTSFLSIHSSIAMRISQGLCRSFAAPPRYGPCLQMDLHRKGIVVEAIVSASLMKFFPFAFHISPFLDNSLPLSSAGRSRANEALSHDSRPWASPLHQRPEAIEDRTIAVILFATGFEALVHSLKGCEDAHQEGCRAHGSILSIYMASRPISLRHSRSLLLNHRFFLAVSLFPKQGSIPSSDWQRLDE
jgi:hypothetical protein